ncbi:transposase [Streptomyces sp. NPDC086023]|uniref:transposase n=1 Tax=Streptomyces sp. NPDC086023 TaxID=3365746 RepID=UPI0037D46196
MSAHADDGPRPRRPDRCRTGAGPVPVPRDSGGRSGDLHRTQRHSRRLRRPFCTSSQTGIIRKGPIRGCHVRKRGGGCGHVRAAIASPSPGRSAAGPPT